MSPKISLNLNDDQRFALMKLRRNVADCCTLPYHDDQFLLKWLRARNFNPVAAEKMLRVSLQWRKKWETDSIGNWTPPQIFDKFYPYGRCGFDKDGAPVLVVPFSGLDLWGLLHCITKDDFIKMTIRELERQLEMARIQAKEQGHLANQLVVIMDMTDFNIRQYLWRPVGDLVITMLQMYEANYPEILKDCYIINVPKIFAVAFSVVKNFLNDYTLSKIHIFKNEPHKWKPALLKQIDSEQLPAHYGGSMRDPDGNPRCPSKVCQGGKIPKFFFNNKGLKLSEGKDDYIGVTIKKGDKLILDFDVLEEGSFLKWGFYSEGHDIKFGVTSKDSNGNNSTHVPLHRVSSHEVEEIGLINCPTPATYSIVFDNSYSFLRSKKLFYSISVSPPIISSSSSNFRNIEE